MNQQEKARSRAKKWYKENKDKALSRIRLRASSVEGRAKIKEWRKEYVILNKEKITQKLKDWYENHKQLMKDRARIWKQKNPEKAQYQRYIERARERNGELGLTLEEFKIIINMPCVYCGFNDGIVGLDRIDSANGYERDNIVPCCKMCNFMKLDSSVEDWFSAMRDIFNNLDYEITPITKTSSRK